MRFDHFIGTGFEGSITHPDGWEMLFSEGIPIEIWGDPEGYTWTYDPDIGDFSSKAGITVWDTGRLPEDGWEQVEKGGNL